MNDSVDSEDDKRFRTRTVETVIRIGVLAALVLYCFQIVKPFIIPVVWGIIIAVASYPGFLRLRGILAFSAMLSTF